MLSLYKMFVLEPLYMETKLSDCLAFKAQIFLPKNECTLTLHNKSLNVSRVVGEGKVHMEETRAADTPLFL